MSRTGDEAIGRSKKRAKTGDRDEQGRFRLGHRAPGPGRPQGSRNRASLVVGDLLEGEAERLTRRAVELALEGDMTAMRLCLERICPPRKQRRVTIDLPEADIGECVARAMVLLIQAVTRGELTPEEGQAVGGGLFTRTA